MIRARREGFALAATILAMLVVGAVVTGGFYAASQEGQITRSLGNADDALYIAETGLNRAMGTTTGAQLDGIAVNGRRGPSTANVTVGSTTLGNYSVTISRLSNALFFVTSTGTVTRGGRYAGASRTVAGMMRRRNVDFDNDAAVVIFGNLTVAGTSEVNGTDVFPTGWAGEGCTANAGTAAVLTNESTTVRTQGSGSIDGEIRRQSLDEGTFTVFGDMTWNELVAMRNIYFPNDMTVGPRPNATVTTCVTSDVENWGHPLLPTSPCFSYAPIIYAERDLRVSSASFGQGILLVRGDLEISGGFTFYGVVVVMGEIRITGTGGHINGTAMVFGGGDLGSTSATFGDALLQYSSCAITRAVNNNTSLSRGVPIYNRSWVDLSAVQGGN